MTEVERFFRRLVSTLAATDPARLQAPLPLDDITGSILPYRANRRALQVDTVEDYEAVLLRLCAGEGDLVRTEPDEARARFVQESRSPNPDLTALYSFEDVRLTLLPEPLLWALAPDPRADYRPPLDRGPGATSADFEPLLHARASVEPELEEPEVEHPGIDEPEVEHPGIDEPEVEHPGIDEPSAPEPEVAEPDAAKPGGAERSVARGPGTAAGSNAEPEPLIVLGAAPLEVLPDTADVGGEPDDRSEPPPTCPYCGGTLPTHRAVNFCPHCGQNQTQILCPECRSEVEPGWRHCVNCGAAVGEA